MYLTTGATTPAEPRPASSPSRTARPSVIVGNVLALGTVSLVSDVSAEMVTAVLPVYLIVGLGLNPLQFGLLDGLYSGATAVLRLVGGYAADRWQRRKFLAGSGYLLSAAARLGLLAANGSAVGIGGAIVVDRFGKGIRTAPRDALISLSVPPQRQGRAFGVHRAMDTTGALLGPLAAMALLARTDGNYQAVFATSLAIALVGVVVFVLFVRDHREQLSRSAVTLRAGLALVRQPQITRICGQVCLFGAATIGDSFVYLILQHRLDLPVTWFPLLPLGVALTYLLLAVPAGHLADRFGRWQVFVTGQVALLIAYLVLAVPVGGHLAGPILITVLVLLGSYYATTDGVLMALTAPLLPAHLRTSGFAVIQTGQALARLVGAVAFGALWTAYGEIPALVSAAAGLCAALLVAVITHRRQTGEPG